jgi:hypothetical protein
MCVEGHAQEESWERCPFCEAERNEKRAAKEVSRELMIATETPVDPGDGAVVVPKRTSSRRALAGWLVAVGGEQDGQDFRIEVGRNTIGKGAESDVVLKDAHASEKHAVLEVSDDGRYRLRDLDSKYGTFVDECRVHGERPISDGDHVRIGNTDLRFRTLE